MNMVTKGVLIGGCVGAGVAAVQASLDGEVHDGTPSVPPAGDGGAPKSPVAPEIGESHQIPMSQVAKVALGAAAVGGAVGLGLEWQARHRARQLTRAARLRRVAAAKWSEAAPRLEHAAEVARDRAHDAVEAARPHVAHAAGLARERAQARLSH